MHPELEFHLIRHGTGKYNIRDVEYPCERNSLLIMHENEPHVYIPSHEYHDKNMCLIFARQVIEHRVIGHAALQRLGPLHHLLLTERQASTIEFLITEIAAECARKEMHWREVVTDHVESFLAILHRVAEGHMSIPEINDPLVQEVVKYLEGTYTERSTLSDVSKRFGICTFTLSKKFNQHMGLGFREYLLQRRILASQKMLEQTDMKIAAIAHKVGFESVNAYNRYFRIVTGMTPAVYRKLSSFEEPNA